MGLSSRELVIKACLRSAHDLLEREARWAQEIRGSVWATARPDRNTPVSLRGLGECALVDLCGAIVQHLPRGFLKCWGHGAPTDLDGRPGPFQTPFSLLPLVCVAYSVRKVPRPPEPVVISGV